MHLLLQAAAPLSTLAAAAGRATIHFQYAWRFHYGDDPSSPPGSGPGTAIFETSLANYSVCEGMEHAPNRFSLKDCRIACSYDPNCLVWQAFPIEHGRLCWQGYTGMNITCTPPDGEEEPTYMDGGRRAVAPDPAFRTDYPFATADAASEVDKDWDVVDGACGKRHFLSHLYLKCDLFTKTGSGQTYKEMLKQREAFFAQPRTIS